VEQAQRVELNSTINGSMAAPTDVDYYVFKGKKDQRVVLSCLASTIDSRFHAALELYDSLRFHTVDNDRLLVYSKANADHSNIILCVVNLDPVWPQAGWLDIPIDQWGIRPDQPYVVHDLLTDERYTWRGRYNWVRLDPNWQAGHILRVEMPRY